MIRLSAYLILTCSLSFVWFINCQDGLRCNSDRDCIRDFGPGFLCQKNKCIRGTQVEVPNQEIVADRKESLQEPSTPDTSDASSGQKESAPDEVQRPDTPSTEKDTPDTSVQQRKLEQPCKDYAHAPLSEQCGAGLKCVRLSSTTAFCFQDCSENSAVCSANTDGRTTCRTVAWDRIEQSKPIRICVKLRDKGQSCDSQQGQYCQTGGAQHLVCHQGTCKQGKLCTQAGCSCEVRPGASPVECDIQKDLACDLNTQKCIKGRKAYEGQPCGAFKNAFYVCEQGHTCTCTDKARCFGVDSVPTTCHKQCDLKNPLSSCSHKKGLFCNKFPSGKGLCIQETCSKQQDCVHKSYTHTCQGQASERRCHPVSKPGTINIGGLCEPASGKSCKEPYYCLPTGTRQVNGETVRVGFCSLGCERSDPKYGDALCSQHGGTAKCTLRNNQSGLQFCGWGCSNGIKCPSQFRCIQASGVCVP